MPTDGQDTSSVDRSGGVQELKRQKARYKSAFTKARNRLLNTLTEETIDRKQIREYQTVFDRAQDELSKTFDQLCLYYQHRGEYESEQGTIEEMEIMDSEYSDSHKQVRDFLQFHSDNQKEVCLGKDLWKQLKRVDIPVFNGEKARYEAWKSAFISCIDSAPATPEYKLLQLRQHLSGDALQCIENLGHSKAAYEFAKERLDRKYGGKKRQIQLFLEELETFPAIKEQNASSLEKFADILAIAVINLMEAGHNSDLGDGALYLRLQKKLPIEMVTMYHRWIHENEETESVTTLRDWVIQEAQFHTTAAETVNGLQQRSRKKASSMFTKTKTPDKLCKMCNQSSHNIWECEAFKELQAHQRWEKAKALSLCFRCLKDYHVGKKCHFSKACGIDGCDKTHNRLLHTSRKENPSPRSPTGATTQRTHTVTDEKIHVGLRTVPTAINS